MLQVGGYVSQFLEISPVKTETKVPLSAFQSPPPAQFYPTLSGDNSDNVTLPPLPPGNIRTLGDATPDDSLAQQNIVKGK